MRNSLMLVLGLVLMASCQPKFEKGEDGMEYRIISDGKGETIQPGDFMVFHVAQFYQASRTDSLLSNTRDGLPAFERLDSATIPPTFYGILAKMRNGDSAVMRILVDSMFKDHPEQMPPFFKNGHWFTTTVKILNIAKTQEESDSLRRLANIEMLDRQAKEDQAQAAKDDDILIKHFADNNIKAERSPLGMYVQILEPGEGNMLDTTMIAKVNYTGRLLDGTTFDSNTDTSFKHPEPFYVNLTDNPRLGTSVITGWNEGLKMLREGSKAKFYIPSGLAYGRRGAPPLIPPHSILVFDIEVLDGESKEEAAKRMNIDLNTKPVQITSMEELQRMMERGEVQLQPE